VSGNGCPVFIAENVKICYDEYIFFCVLEREGQAVPGYAFMRKR